MAPPAITWMNVVNGVAFPIYPIKRTAKNINKDESKYLDVL